MAKLIVIIDLDNGKKIKITLVNKEREILDGEYYDGDEWCEPFRFNKKNIVKLLKAVEFMFE